MSNKQVPMLDLVGQHAPLRDQILQAVGELIDNGNFILGQAVARFEEEAAEWIGVRHAIGLSSGTDAIYLALRAAGVGPGDEVVTPVFSFFAIAEAIERTGARAVYVDVDPQTLNIDPVCCREALSPRTKAIVPVHLYGHPAAMSQLQDGIGERKIAIIEDAAQAIGARSGDLSAGALGDCGAFSFYPTKNLGACGDGGLVTTNRDDLAEWVMRLRDHGQSGKYEHSWYGWNCRLDAFQAAILSIKLARLDDWNRARRAVAAAYRERLGSLDLILPPEEAGVVPVYHQFTIRLQQRDQLQAFLAEQGIASAIHYPRLLSDQPACETENGTYPVAESATREVLSLPIYPEMDEEGVDRVAEAVRSWFESR